jgi:hypothetical protein
MRNDFYQVTGIDTYVTVNKHSKLVTAVVIDHVGNVVMGHALCDDADVFDENFGIDLAIARAESRYSARQVKLLLQESKNRG